MTLLAFSLLACGDSEFADIGAANPVVDTDTGGDTDSGRDTDTDTGIDTDSGGDTDTGIDTDSGGDTDTNSGGHTGTDPDEFVELVVDGARLTRPVIVGYTTRTGNTTSFVGLSEGNVYPGITFVFYESGGYALGTDYTCAISSSVTYTDAAYWSWYANYTAVTSCTYRFSELGDAVGERMIGEFEAHSYTADLSASVQITEGRFSVVLDAAN